jgi:hypothetical protein
MSVNTVTQKLDHQDLKWVSCVEYSKVPLINVPKPMVKEIKIDKKENTTVLRFYLDIANNITD